MTKMFKQDPHNKVRQPALHFHCGNRHYIFTAVTADADASTQFNKWLVEKK